MCLYVYILGLKAANGKVIWLVKCSPGPPILTTLIGTALVYARTRQVSKKNTILYSTSVLTWNTLVWLDLTGMLRPITSFHVLSHTLVTTLLQLPSSSYEQYSSRTETSNDHFTFHGCDNIGSVTGMGSGLQKIQQFPNIQFLGPGPTKSNSNKLAL